MPETSLNDEYVPPVTVGVAHNSDTEKYEIVDMATGQPALTKKGTRMDGGGHDFEDKAARQVGYVQKGLDAARKKVETQDSPQ